MQKQLPRQYLFAFGSKAAMQLMRTLSGLSEYGRVNGFYRSNNRCNIASSPWGGGDGSTNMKHFSACEATDYIAYISDHDIPFSQHQISKSFTDGMSGNAYVSLASSAIIVGDFIELAGSFDEALYEKIIEIQEAHVIEPPLTWKKEIEKRYNGEMTEYTRISFDPMSANCARKAGSTVNYDNRLKIDDNPVEIKPIDTATVIALSKEEWSEELVKNTMGNENLQNNSPGFGFVACIGAEIIGGIGCYAHYRNGIEVEIDTRPEYQRRGVATILSRRMLAECGSREMECHWDAMNAASASLAQKLGFIEKSQYQCLLLSQR